MVSIGVCGGSSSGRGSICPDVTTNAVLGHIARIILARSRPFKPPGHLDVGKHRRYAVFLQQLKRLVNVTGFLYRLAVFFEDFSDRSSDDGFVVNDEDNFAHCCE